MKKILLPLVAVLALSFVGIPGMSTPSAYAQEKATETADPKASACAEITGKKAKSACMKTEAAKEKKAKKANKSKRKSRRSKKVE